jgi:hypothetical protein
VLQKPVVESLVVSLAVIVLDVLSREEAQVAVTERDHSIETFLWIVDQIFLVAIHPASNGEHEELQRMGYRERLNTANFDLRTAFSGRRLRPHLQRQKSPRDAIWREVELLIRPSSS